MTIAFAAKSALPVLFLSLSVVGTSTWSAAEPLETNKSISSLRELGRELGIGNRPGPAGKARYLSQTKGSKLGETPQDIFMSPDALELSLDSEEIVRSQNQDSLSVSYYRNLQNRRVWDDNPNSPKYAELDSESFAQHLGLFFSTKNFIDLLRQSEFGTLYRDVSNTMKRASNYATVSAGRNAAGDIEFNHGEAKRGRLFDLRLGVSTHNGIEPKLKLPEDLSIKYDLRSGSALLEYEINF